MNHSQISSLTLNESLAILHSRLSEAGVSNPSDAQLQAEFNLYVAELIADEDARLAELARIDDLKLRFSELSDHGLLQGALDISNIAAHFRDSIVNNSDKDQAEQHMLILESSYDQASAGLAQYQINAEALAYLTSTDWLILREADSGELCPAEIKQARAEARARIIK